MECAHCVGMSRASHNVSERDRSKVNGIDLAEGLVVVGLCYFFDNTVIYRLNRARTSIS